MLSLAFSTKPPKCMHLTHHIFLVKTLCQPPKPSPHLNETQRTQPAKAVAAGKHANCLGAWSKLMSS